MGKFEKLLEKIRSGQSDENIAFADVCWLVERLGYESRTSGSHRIYQRLGRKENLNLQPKKDGKAKSYQVRQVRDEIEILLQEREEQTDG